MTLKFVSHLFQTSHVVVTMDRVALIEEALSLITKDRHESYGEASEHFDQIARLWTILMRRKVTPSEVILCLVAMKVARLSGKLDHMDSWVDLAGYAALGGELSYGNVPGEKGQSEQTVSDTEGKEEVCSLREER